MNILMIMVVLLWADGKVVVLVVIDAAGIHGNDDGDQRWPTIH